MLAGCSGLHRQAWKCSRSDQAGAHTVCPGDPAAGAAAPHWHWRADRDQESLLCRLHGPSAAAGARLLLPLSALRACRISALSLTASITSHWLAVSFGSVFAHFPPSAMCACYISAPALYAAAHGHQLASACRPLCLTAQLQHGVRARHSSLEGSLAICFKCVSQNLGCRAPGGAGQAK